MRSSLVKYVRKINEKTDERQMRDRRKAEEKQRKSREKAEKKQRN
jgi:hypothetical protein